MPSRGEDRRRGGTLGRSLRPDCGGGPRATQVYQASQNGTQNTVYIAQKESSKDIKVHGLLKL